ncbi:hypothetical protein A0256_20910 [Mucilaginibacter sp. PAMC 26640]|nr:hypothetical protein A0256_20910 [Mucilaginibacter sp. PAMC 26640]
MATTVITTSFNTDEFKSLIAECIAQSFKDQITALASPVEATTILTRQETAKLLSLSLPTLHIYTKRGLIKSHRLGTKVRYKREDVEAALKQIRTGK